jgi:hypothetical protein
MKRYIEQKTNMNASPENRYEPDAPQHTEGGVWPPRVEKEEPLPPIAEVVREGIDLIRGELLPLLEKRMGPDKANIIQEMLTPHVQEFHNPEPVRTYVALEDLAAQDMLDAERASELFHLMKEGIATNDDWKKRYGKSSADTADKRVRGLIAQAGLPVKENGVARTYTVMDLNRYEKDLAA